MDRIPCSRTFQVQFDTPNHLRQSLRRRKPTPNSSGGPGSSPFYYSSSWPYYQEPPVRDERSCPFGHATGALGRGRAAAGHRRGGAARGRAGRGGAGAGRPDAGATDGEGVFDVGRGEASLIFWGGVRGIR